MVANIIIAAGAMLIATARVFAESIKAIDEKTFYCLLDLTLLASQWDDKLKSLTTNPEVADAVSDADNYVIAKITLK